MRRNPRIVIIGAGIGGPSAAALLRRAFDVTVFERAPAPGGKIRQIDVGDEKIDAGPTVFTMRWVFEEIFADAGHAFDAVVRVRKLDMIARHFWRDGGRLDLYADNSRSADAIRAFAGAADAQNYLSFCDRTRKIYETLLDPFMLADKPSLLGLMFRRNPFALAGISPFATLWGALSRRFRDPRLRQLFARYATYCGSSPFHAPATLMLIAHVEQAGVWMVEGGMQAIANALADIASRNGAAFHYGVPVEKILARAGRASGVELADKERIDADIVLFNGDPGALAAGNLGPAARGAVKARPGAALSQSAITWTMRARRPTLNLSVHNVFFSDRYEDEFDAVFKDRRAPNIPTTYIFAPDRLDPAESREDERLFCLTNAPPASAGAVYSEKEIDSCRKAMIDHLKACGLTLEPAPGTVTATSPADFAALFPGSGGALYGMASHGWRASFQRGGVRSRMPGLYLAGGGVHPGPGVPMAALSGRAAAAAIRADHV